jgi:hypothetical protein
MSGTTPHTSPSASPLPLDRALYLANGALAVFCFGLYLLFVGALLLGEGRTSLEVVALVSVALLPLGAAFGLAAHQFRHHARRRWRAQVLPLLLSVVSVFALVLLYEQAVMTACDNNRGICP